MEMSPASTIRHRERPAASGLTRVASSAAEPGGIFRDGGPSGLSGPRSRSRAFSLIELLIVVAIMSVLTGGAMLRLDWAGEEARTVALKHNLATLRRAIDDFHADRHRYPVRLDELVETRYLRQLPVDPTTGIVGSWTVVPSAPGRPDVYDVRSPTEGYRCH